MKPTQKTLKTLKIVQKYNTINFSSNNKWNKAKFRKFDVTKFFKEFSSIEIQFDQDIPVGYYFLI